MKKKLLWFAAVALAGIQAAEVVSLEVRLRASERRSAAQAVALKQMGAWFKEQGAWDARIQDAMQDAFKHIDAHEAFLKDQFPPASLDVWVYDGDKALNNALNGGQ